MTELLNDKFDDIRALVAMMPAIEEAWVGPEGAARLPRAPQAAARPRGRRDG